MWELTRFIGSFPVDGRKGGELESARSLHGFTVDPDSEAKPVSADEIWCHKDIIVGLLKSFIKSPEKSLSEASWRSLRQGRFEAARVGKYPVWSWLRVTTSFHLDP